MKRVFVCRPIPMAGLHLLRNAGVELLLHSAGLPPTREELLSGVRGCDGILSLLSDRIDAEVMEAAGAQLKVVANFAVGYNNIDVAAAKARNICVGNTPDVLTDATADIAIGLLIASARMFGDGFTAARDGRWRTWEPLGWIGQDLNGKTLGIVGMGRIGFAVAKRMHAAWNMKVLYTARSAKQEVDQSLSAQHVDLDELLTQSDFISLHVPLSEQTRGCISYPQFELMKKTAVLVNTARGEVIDQQALVDALKQGRIFGAGLDVCTPEPIPLDHPLLSLPNCVLLPHIGSATTLARNAMATRAAENILAGISGRPLPYPVI
ncbi:MAG: D-glycerate dehydrogenase [Pirellulales bacterium]